jgi:hypothetical protein
LFDADGDVILISTLQAEAMNCQKEMGYADRFYLNDGKGNFTYDSVAYQYSLAASHVKGQMRRWRY